MGSPSGLNRCGTSRPLPGFDHRTLQLLSESLFFPVIRVDTSSTGDVVSMINLVPHREDGCETAGLSSSFLTFGTSWGNGQF